MTSRCLIALIAGVTFPVAAAAQEKPRPEVRKHEPLCTGSAQQGPCLKKNPVATEVTHQVKEQTSCYASSRHAKDGGEPSGTIAADTKVTIIAHVGEYALVWTEDGRVAGYVPTRVLAPLNGDNARPSPNP